MLNQLFLAVLILSLTGTIVSIPLVLFKNLLLKRYNGKWYYYIWLFALIMFVIPVGYRVSCWVGEPSALSHKVQTISSISDDEPVSNSLLQMVLKFGLYIINSQTICIIWLLGVIVSVSYYVFVSIWFERKIICRSPYINDMKIIVILQDGCRKLNIKADIKLCFNNEINSPILFGLFSPIIVLPISVLQSDSADLEMIISHELTHYKNKDILYKYFIMFVKVIHWFNPFVYAIAKTINEACDYACDYTVTQQMNNQFSYRYANMILNTMEISILGSQSQHISYLTANLFKNNKNIKRRFELIMMKNNKKKMGITAFAITAILGASTYTTIMAAEALNKPDVTDLNIINFTITETTAKPFDGRLDLTIPFEALLDNGDGSYTFESTDGREVIVTFPQDAEGNAYTLIDGKIQYTFQRISQ